MNGKELSVVLVEDDAMVRGWLRLALEGTEFRVSGVAGSAAEARELIRRRPADVLLVDYRLPDGVGNELIKQVRRDGVETPALMMTANSQSGFNELAREAGAQGTTLKSGSPSELLAALRAVSVGERAFDSRHPRRPPGQAALSPRERQVVRLVAAGKTNREIADALGVGTETVKTLVARTFGKLGAHKRAEAVAAATRLGLL